MLVISIYLTSCLIYQHDKTTAFRALMISFYPFIAQGQRSEKFGSTRHGFTFENSMQRESSQTVMRNIKVHLPTPLLCPLVPFSLIRVLVIHKIVAHPSHDTVVGVLIDRKFDKYNTIAKQIQDSWRSVNSNKL